MINETPATSVQQNLGTLLNQVQNQHEQFIITDAGKPVAALIDITLFERVCKNEQQFQTMSNEIAQAFADSNEDEINQLLNKAKQV